MPTLPSTKRSLVNFPVPFTSSLCVGIVELKPIPTFQPVETNKEALPQAKVHNDSQSFHMRAKTSVAPKALYIHIAPPLIPQTYIS